MENLDESSGSEDTDDDIPKHLNGTVSNGISKKLNGLVPSSKNHNRIHPVSVTNPLSPDVCTSSKYTVDSLLVKMSNVSASWSASPEKLVLDSIDFEVNEVYDSYYVTLLLKYVMCEMFRVYPCSQ